MREDTEAAKHDCREEESPSPLGQASSGKEKPYDEELVVRLSRSQDGQPSAPGSEEGPVGLGVAQART